MAHELVDGKDEMFSVRERPWHGLGIILEDYPTVEEAQKHSGLTWNVELLDVFAKGAVEGSPRNVFPAPNNRAVVRVDTAEVLGMVGTQYVPYQNHEMWDFIHDFKSESGGMIETAGSLKAGRNVWVLMKNRELEYLTGDPIEEYFLFSNGFDGFTPIQVLFTNVRVVCNNTLTAALSGARNIYKVRHTKSADDKLRAVQEALQFHHRYQEKMDLRMSALLAHDMVEQAMRNTLHASILPAPEEVDEEDLSRAEINRRKTVDDIMLLTEKGAGTDIPGVRGTAYGLYQAVAEFVDHFKEYRTYESRFASLMLQGGGHQLKQRAFNTLTSLAA